LVKGFKDSSGKFHPTGQIGVSKRTRYAKVRYSNGAGSMQVLEQSVKDFATNRKVAYQKFKANQEDKFQKDLELRRKFRSKLISAYRQARAQNVKSGRDLEKFIRGQIPDLPKDKGINKFVETVIREFKKQEGKLESQKKGKSEEEKAKLDQAFENSLKQSEAQFRVVQAEQEKKFRVESDKRDTENKKEIEKLKKKAQDLEDANTQKEKDRKEADRLEKENASKAEQASAEQKAKESEKMVVQEQKDETTFANEVISELKEDTKEVKQEDFDFGFPEAIV